MLQTALHFVIGCVGCIFSCTNEARHHAYLIPHCTLRIAYFDKMTIVSFMVATRLFKPNILNHLSDCIDDKVWLVEMNMVSCVIDCKLNAIR